MATCLQVPMVPSTLRSSSSSSISTNSSSSSSSFDMNPKIGWRNVNKRLNYRCSSSKIPMHPPIDLNDPFLRRLAAHAQDNPTMKPSPNSQYPPYLDVFLPPDSSSSSGGGGAHGAQGARRGYGRYGYAEHRTRRPPPDLPSILLDGRIIYINMPLVDAVTELVFAQLLYLQFVDDTAPICLYINSTGTTREDNQVVALEANGFALYSAMELVKNDVETVCVGTAGGHSCLLLAAGKLGRRFMLPHSRIVMKAPRVPATGLLQATDVFLKMKEAALNRDMLFKLFALHTGHRFDDIKEKLKDPLYMGAKEALEFGVVDQILWQGQEDIMPDLVTPELWDKISLGKSVIDP